jgi:hypothetical protein
MRRTKDIWPVDSVRFTWCLETLSSFPSLSQQSTNSSSRSAKWSGLVNTSAFSVLIRTRRRNQLRSADKEFLARPNSLRAKVLKLNYDWRSNVFTENDRNFRYWYLIYNVASNYRSSAVFNYRCTKMAISSLCASTSEISVEISAQSGKHWEQFWHRGVFRRLG